MYQWTSENAGMTRSEGSTARCRVGMAQPVEKRKSVWYSCRDDGKSGARRG